MVIASGKVVKLGPVASKLPPVAASYHWYVPPGAVADNVAVPPAQIEVPDVTGADGEALKIITTLLDCGPHGPGGSSDLKVSVAVVSPAPGV